MNSRSCALWAALAAATSWATKTVAIGVAGGLDKSPLEAPLFFAGLVWYVVAVAAIGVAATSGAAAWLRALAGVGGFALGLALTLAVDAIVGAFHSGAERHWVWVEFNLWVAALVALAVAVRLYRADRPQGAPADDGRRTQRGRAPLTARR